VKGEAVRLGKRPAAGCTINGFQNFIFGRGAEGRAHLFDRGKGWAQRRLSSMAREVVVGVAA
jgi:hypothetical protein